METALTLHTERLILRSFTLDDAPDVQRLANDPDVASTTYEIKHPYEVDMAEEWIQWCYHGYETGESIDFAITFSTDRNVDWHSWVGIPASSSLQRCST